MRMELRYCDFVILIIALNGSLYLTIADRVCTKSSFYLEFIEKLNRNCTLLDDQTVAGRTLIHHVDVPTKKARFGMACFWAPDSLFGATPGIIRTRVGYSGGTTNNPTYQNLGDHTEAIEIDYDPKTIEYKTLLQIFWANHNPASRNKKQYTSIIFIFNEEQKAEAEVSVKEEQKKYQSPIVTTVIPAKEFYEAEDYHQKYRLQQHPCLCKAIGLNSTLLKTSTLAARLNGYVIGVGGAAQFERDITKFGLDESNTDYVRELVKKFEGRGLIC